VHPEQKLVRKCVGQAVLYLVLDNNHTAVSNMKRAGDALAWWVEELPLLCPVALQFLPTRQLTPSSNYSFFFQSHNITSSQRQTLRH